MDYQIFGNLGVAGAALFFAYMIFKAFTEQIMKVQQEIQALVIEMKEHDARMIENITTLTTIIKQQAEAQK